MWKAHKVGVVVDIVVDFGVVVVEVGGVDVVDVVSVVDVFVGSSDVDGVFDVVVVVGGGGVVFDVNVDVVVDFL